MAEKCATGEVFVLAGFVAGGASDEDDFGGGGVGVCGWGAEGDAALLLGEFSVRDGCEGEEEGEDGEAHELFIGVDWTQRTRQHAAGLRSSCGARCKKVSKLDGGEKACFIARRQISLRITSGKRESESEVAADAGAEEVTSGKEFFACVQQV